MFYNQTLLSNEGPLATVWLAANLDKKLSKNQLIHTNIVKSAKAIINSENPSTFNVEISDNGSSQSQNSKSLGHLVASQPIALRLSGQLLYGVVKIYSRKEKYLLDDVSNVLAKLKSIFKSNNVRSIILPASKTMANVNRLVLADTITESNIGPQLLQQNPLSLDLDDEIQAATRSDRSIAESSQIMAREVADNTDYHMGLAFDDSIEQGRNASRMFSDTTMGFGDITGINKSRRTGNVTDDDNDDFMTSKRGGDLAGDDLATADPDEDLVLDFGNDADINDDVNDGYFDNDMPPDAPGQFSDVEELYIDENQQDNKDNGAVQNNSTLPLDFAEQTVEQGRDAAVTTLNELTFGADTLLKQADIAGDNPVNVENIFDSEPLETVEQQKFEEVNTEEGDTEQQTKKKQRAKTSRSKTRREVRKRLVIDNEASFSDETFRRLEPTPLNAEYQEAKKKLEKMTGKLLAQKRLFYLKKDSNPGNLFINFHKFKNLWDYKNSKIVDDGERNKRRKVSEQEIAEDEEYFDVGGFDIPPSPILEFDNVTTDKAIMDEVIEKKEHADGEPASPIREAPDVDMGFDFDLDYGDHFNPDDSHSDKENHDYDEISHDREPSSESFIQKMSSNEFASSMAESSRYHQSIDEDNQSQGSRGKKRDFEAFSQIESHYDDENEGNGNSISRSTLQIASILRDDFLEDKNATITLDQVIEKDSAGGRFGGKSLSNNPRKERVRCFFELLVLATGDAISLKQKTTPFGEISINYKDALFERF
ncbi:kleisin alpha [Saccharomycopsis crataegensis]|uniref:Kleisin alpha n=1 Tax=Saccharomycopsis crataegensis TaxID=43959 RepID=A0AAV5QG25_9ASCO|nr:kleisin alpha [Saccharomycopsis crataegensis]